MSLAGPDSPVAAGIGNSSQANPYVDFHPSGLAPRVSPTGFTVGIFLVLGISIITIIARLALRLARTKSLAADDYFLIVALVTLIGACATQQHYRDVTYSTVNVESGNEIPSPHFPENSIIEIQVLDSTSVLLWTSIFCVKFSFLFFFRKLITRVHKLQIYWWCVFGLVLPSALVCIPLGFIECTHIGPDVLAHCPVDQLIAREHVYLNTTTTLDIITDILIISLPVVLLWNVKIDMTKKLTLMGVLGLSVVMIIIALIRVTMAPLAKDVIDTTWLFFWQILEASIALVMVSVSAFRSLFGQAGSNNDYNQGDAYARNKASALERGRGNFAGHHVTVSRDVQMPAVAIPKGAHSKIVPLEGFEMVDITPPSTTETTQHRNQSPEPSAQPTTPRTPGMGYARAASPMTARCWSDNAQQNEKRRSIGLSAGSVREKVKHMRARSRTPSLGEALIDERYHNAVPEDWA